MTVGGWILLSISWLIILVAVVFCFAKMFSIEKGKNSSGDIR